MRTASSPSARARKHWDRGQKHAKAGQWDRAAAAFEAGSRLAPRELLFPLNHARALLKAGQRHEALEPARAAVALEPDNLLAAWLLATCLTALQRFPEVIDVLQRIPADQRNDWELHRMLAMALTRCGRHHEAVSSFLDALALKLDDAVTHYRLGLTFNELDLKKEATECFKTALELGLGSWETGVRGLLAFYEREVCAWDGARGQVEALHASLAALPPDAAVLTTPFAYCTLLDSPAEQLRAARSCARAIAEGVDVFAPPARRAHERLRIGYVSADFHEHATSILMAELFERHDRERFEVTLYSHGASDGSAMRARIEAAAEHFVDVQMLTDLEAARRVRDDEIDILVDLKGHTANNRLTIFAYRAAPIQASYVGFPGTSGADWIDYVIGDPIVTPREHQPFYSEKIAQLPGCYQPNDRQRVLLPPPSRAACGLPEDALVLCGFNQPYKISAEVFDVWCGLLHELPDAVLWLLQWNGQAPEHLKREAQARGIDPGRLVWAPRARPIDHIARLQNADLLIDTWPCNAHTTASDALWAGVPVVTWTGQTFASRVASSLLHDVGLPQLACHDIAGYRQCILDLARDDGQRRALKDHLVAARTGAPLFDSERRTRDLEALYERMWARHAAGLPSLALPAMSA